MSATHIITVDKRRH